MDSLENRVLTFVRDNLPRGPQPSVGSCLVEDLGVDGDDACDLFEAFGKEFDVDLSPLYANWRRHFRSEADVSRYRQLKWFLAAVILPYLAAMFLSAAVGGRVWLWFLGLVAVWVLVARRRASHREGPLPLLPISVEDLVMAARAKQWRQGSAA